MFIEANRGLLACNLWAEMPNCFPSRWQPRVGTVNADHKMESNERNQNRSVSAENSPCAVPSLNFICRDPSSPGVDICCKPYLPFPLLAKDERLLRLQPATRPS